jgi:lysophospholipase L1-like esterase
MPEPEYSRAKACPIPYRWTLFAIYLFLLAFASTPLEAKAAIHVIGDSHSREFRQIPSCKIHWLGPITMHRVGRDGLACVNLQQLKVKEGDVAVFAFGEIDVRCHIGKQRDQKNRDLDEVIENLVIPYFHTLALNRALYKKLLIVVYSVTPPVEICLNPKFPSYGPVEDRVAIAKTLNARLADLCKQLEIEFLDVYEDYANPDGTLKVEYSDGGVHIAPAHNQAIAQKLNEILSRNRID